MKFETTVSKHQKRGVSTIEAKREETAKSMFVEENGRIHHHNQQNNSHKK